MLKLSSILSSNMSDELEIIECEDIIEELDVDMDLLNDSTAEELDDISEETKDPEQEKASKQNWISDHSVPLGWRYKKSGRNFHLISPSGKIFKSRRAAFEFLSASGFCNSDEIKAMKSTLRYEEWMENENIPRNWMFKKLDCGGVRYVAQGGELFKSHSKAVSFVQKYEKYFTEEDVKKLMTHAKIKNSYSHSGGQWRKCETDLPEGWSFKEVMFGVRKQVHYLAPNGLILIGKRKVLNYMTETNFPKYQIEQMRNSLKTDGWSEDSQLPPKWLYKIMGKTNGAFFISPSGIRFKSNNAAVIYLKSTSAPEEEVRLMESFKKQNRIKRDESDFEYCNNLYPEGWKLKKSTFGKTYRTIFQTPTDKIILGKRNVLRFMLESQYPKDQIDNVRKSIQEDGWCKKPSLPENWLYKNSGVRKECLFISPDGHLFKTASKVIQYLLSNRPNSKELEMFQMLNTKNRTRSLPKDKPLRDVSGWTKCKEPIPEGWMFKMDQVGKNAKRQYKRFLSPDGKVFKGKRAILKDMIGKNFDECKITELRNSFKLEGWSESLKLPRKWLYKNSGTRKNSSFISPEGHLFKTSSKVIQYLQSTKGQTKDIMMFKSFGTFNARSTPLHSTMDGTGWKNCNELFPKGWICKKSMFGKREKVDFQTEEGTILRGKRDVLKFMNYNQYPEDQVKNVRTSLLEDGWSFKSDLPENWLHKLEGAMRCSIFISPSGDKLSSVPMVIKYLSSTTSTNQTKDIDMFLKFDASIKKAVNVTRIAMPRERKPRSKDLTGWTPCDELMPKGWMYKTDQVGNNSNKKYTKFLSPGGKIFKGKRAILKTMIEEKYPEQQIICLKESLKLDGWSSDKLPSNWFYKKRGRHDIFMSPAGVFESQNIALKFARSQGSPLSADDISLIESFPL